MSAKFDTDANSLTESAKLDGVLPTRLVVQFDNCDAGLLQQPQRFFFGASACCCHLVPPNFYWRAHAHHRSACNNLMERAHETFPFNERSWPGFG
ncbi:hypothetical protein ACS15_0398 [Ralstonia insidiosa]|uniref:Uncharacterized protein n=1 Tax=Ralstonia insidiosa TaxID=190721 RepID=A0AAC9BCH1_9RALS|nr:hypothetical protein ACS15_0398 [Ralstonia insidiosa]